MKPLTCLSFLLAISACTHHAPTRSIVGSTRWVVPSASIGRPDALREMTIGTDVYSDQILHTSSTGRLHLRFVDRADVLFGPDCTVALNEAATDINREPTRFAFEGWRTNAFDSERCMGQFSSPGTIALDFGDFSILITNRFLTLDFVDATEPFCSLAAVRLYVDGLIDDSIDDGFVQIKSADRTIVLDKLQDAVVIETCKDGLSIKQAKPGGHVQQIKKLEKEQIQEPPEKEDDPRLPEVPPPPVVI